MSLDKVEDGRITETIAFHFDNAEQQRRFHDRLNDPNDWKAIATSLRSELARKEEALKVAAEEMGWHGRGTNSTVEFYCEFCKQHDVDYTQIQHTENCKVLVVRAALQPSSSEVQS